MEDINFIPANELPVAVGDKVDVLCLEDGALKQKPASGLGGNYDFVVKLHFVDDSVVVELVSSITHDEAFQKLKDGMELKAFIHEDGTNLPPAYREDMNEWLWNGEANGAFYVEDGGSIYFEGYNLGFTILPDNIIDTWWR